MDDTDLWLRIETDNGVVDVVDTCAAALQALDIEVDRRDDDVLVLRDTGIELSPAGLEVERTERGWRSSSIVVVEGRGALADGLFEYQHNVGDTVKDALHAGFTQWAKLDLPPLLDVVSHSSEHCMHLELKMPVDGVERIRRIVLGPVLCFQQKKPATSPASSASTSTSTPAPKKPGFFARLFKRTAEVPVEAPSAAIVADAPADAPNDGPADDDKHDPFCPCCMTTRLMIADVLKPLLADDGTFGVRLFASRDNDGSVVADVRFNGRDSDDGIAVLKHYATTWPGRGLEYRKQYAVIYTPPLDN